MQWDGSRWMRWDGTRWIPAESTPQPVPSGPGGTTPGRSMSVWPFVVIGVLAVALVGALIAAAFFAFRNNDPVAVPSPPQTSTATPSPLAPQTYTLYFVNTDFPGGVYGAGVKVRGDQASGFVGVMQSGDIGCFNGNYANGTLTGTLVVPPDGEGGGPVTQSFSWPVTGSGESFRLVSIGEVQPLREVPLVTMNDYADKPTAESWEPLFASCNALAGGIG
jgi:hypothetical protein